MERGFFRHRLQVQSAPVVAILELLCVDLKLYGKIFVYMRKLQIDVFRLATICPLSTVRLFVWPNRSLIRDLPRPFAALFFFDISMQN